MSQTVRRAMSIIEFCAERPRSLGELADHVQVHKSTVLRLAQTLEAAGFARQLPDGRYAVGFRLVAIAQQSLDDMDLRTIAHPHLERLGDQYGHTIHFASLVDDEIIYVDKVEGRGALKMQSRVGRPAELHTAGVAKAVLAYLEEPLVTRLLSRATYQRYTPNTLTSPADLRAELAVTRERGWAEDDGEFEDFVACVAAPVRDARGNVRAAVSITALQALAPLDRLREHVPVLIDTCAAISRDLGYIDKTGPADTDRKDSLA
jgi:DNA-binding IclR family transcriptional regulator